MRSSGGGGRSFSSGGSRSFGSFSGGRTSSTFNHSRPTSNNFGNYNSSPFSSGGSPRPVRPIIFVNSGNKTSSSPYGTYNTNPYGQQSKPNNEPYHKGYRGPTGGPRVSIGCLYSFLLIVIIITLMAVVFGGLWSAMYGQQNPNSQSDITYSTTQREPLPSNAVTVKNGYYTDELGWITSKSKVESGMKSFYEETGVMPYLYLTDTVDGETSPKKNDFINFADAKYDELFEAANGQIDEAHLLVIFHEYYDGEYTVYYTAGVQAQSVIDEEAGEILLDYFDRYYYDSSKDNSEYFSAVFKEAGEAIMKVTRPAWYYPTIVGGIILIALIIFAIFAIRAKNKKEQDKRDQEILNTPLDTFGDNETTVKAEDLAKKYDTVYKNNDN
ncbi:MAG: hypothetical protein J6X24_00585 [Firmicutes bacterium]|nr:hypothetical protein [Bacillota bacterium]